MDPGAVPGRSTKVLKLLIWLENFGGPETGSTRVVKMKSVSGMVPPLSGYIIVANDNYAFVAANDNSAVRLAVAA